ncbi:MAG TPA: ABC transporter permease, partial [Dermatophilaceae bacterium]|nr:ABC transporter permease [Dermatophilaceae bacterium]
MTATAATRPEAASTGRDSTFTGTGTLVRFLLRRDRVKLPAWTLGIAVFVLYYAAALPTIFPTDEALQGAATFAEGPVGALLGGPGYGFDDLTIARFLVGQYGLYFLLAAAVMSILLVSRHTRVEEQHGRAELIRANVVGHHAPLTAALIVAVITNLTLALLVFAAMAGSGFAASSSLLFGVGVGAGGLAFAGLTAMTVQVTEYPRAASGMAGAALGAAFVIRAAGDLIGEHGSWLSWLSPLAWPQQTRVFVDDRWWPLTLSVLFAAAMAAIGYWLASRRDLGAGLVAARPGRAEAAPWLRSPFTFALRLQRASL